MEDKDIEKAGNDVLEALKEMDAEEIKKFMLNSSEKNIEAIKEEVNDGLEITKFLENRNFNFLKNNIIFSLVSIENIINDNTKEVK